MAGGGADDETWMRLAIQLAAGGEGRVEPNPMVGCVLVKDGQLIGQGHHRTFGGPHAEIDALDSLPSPNVAAGATAYVSLEPCCHHGKTPPCADRLIDARVARVVVAMRDPFPKVDGGGLQRLRQAGIETTVGVCRQQAVELNAPYLKRVRSGLPWVIAKWAMTADGRVATRDGESKWITNDLSRRQVHQLRGRVDAIVVGMGTLWADDPMLTARLTNAAGDAQPPCRVATRIGVCRTRLPKLDSKLITSAGTVPTRLFVSPEIAAEATVPYADLGVQIVPLAAAHPHEMVCEILERLGGEDATNVMIEGGPLLLGSFVDESRARCLIDECHVYVGARIFGGAGAAGPIAGAGIGAITATPRLRLCAVDRFDDDVRMIYRRG